MSWLSLAQGLLQSILSVFVPKKKGSVVFGSMVGWSGWSTGFNNSSKSLFLFLLSNGRHDLVTWVTDSPKEYLSLMNKGYPVAYKYSLTCFWKVLRAEFLVTTEDPEHLTYSDLPGRFNVVQLWHGFPLKKIGPDAIRESHKGGRRVTSEASLATKLHDVILLSFPKTRQRPYFLTVAASREDQKIFRRVFYSRRVEILGSPRNDILFNSHLASDDYGTKLDLRRFSKVLLYAPTFRDRATGKEPFSESFSPILGDYLSRNNYVLLVKDHPTTEFSKPHLKAMDNVVDVSDLVSDIQELLIHVDFLITDYSSVTFDFVLTDKPIIFYPYDYEEYVKNCRGLNFDYFTDLPGPFARNEVDLLELIRTVADWSVAKDYVERYRLFKKRFNEFEDGLSSQRVLRCLGILPEA